MDPDELEILSYRTKNINSRPENMSRRLIYSGKILELLKKTYPDMIIENFEFTSRGALNLLLYFQDPKDFTE